MSDVERHVRLLTGALLTATLLSASGEAVAQAPEATVQGDAKWYDTLDVGVFADAYYSFNFNRPRPQGGPNAGGLPVGGNLYRAYDTNDGFALNWAGVDASYLFGSVGGTVGLRFGPSTVPYNANDIPFGAQFVKQAYATWKPAGADGPLTLDFGKYDQPFGSEVADSQYNINYTRSFLYWLAQPLYFTGLRVDYVVAPEVDVKLFAVNGWNRIADNNAMKDLGAQLMVKPLEQTAFYVGYMLGAEQPDVVTGVDAAGDAIQTSDTAANHRYRHFVDLVADINPTDQLRFLFNADYGTEELDTTHSKWYGANLAVGYEPTEEYLVSVRGEVYVDDGLNFGADRRKLYDGTLTLGYLPSPNLVLKLDTRADFADQSLFLSKGPSDDGTQKLGKHQITATLGVVATTN
jgi:hypothetical protein